jgi:hypothetical protein
LFPIASLKNQEASSDSLSNRKNLLVVRNLWVVLLRRKMARKLLRFGATLWHVWYVSTFLSGVVALLL